MPTYCINGVASAVYSNDTSFGTLHMFQFMSSIFSAPFSNFSMRLAPISLQYVTNFCFCFGSVNYWASLPSFLFTILLKSEIAFWLVWTSGSFNLLLISLNRANTNSLRLLVVTLSRAPSSVNWCICSREAALTSWLLANALWAASLPNASRKREKSLWSLEDISYWGVVGSGNVYGGSL